MNRLFLFVLVTLLITSCSKGIEKDAKEQMKETIDELDLASVKITDIKTVFANDSLCILHFNSSAVDGYGNTETGLYEYVYFIQGRSSNKEIRKEAFITLDYYGENSILKSARRNYDSKLWEKDNIASMNDKDRKAWHIYRVARLYMMNHGSIIPPKRQNATTEKESRYDIDKW